MPLVKVENRDGKPIGAEIYKDSALIGVSDAGQIELPVGDYEAKAIGYDSKRFRVRNQPSNSVTMSLVTEVNTKEQGFFKKLNQRDWFVLIAVSTAVVAYATYYTIKKRKNAKG
jgi:hypothetical protein